MLNRLPKWLPEWPDLINELGKPSTAEIAKALGVSRRTVERWSTGKPPRSALLSLWWLSSEGHNIWDCEMHNRTVLALQTNQALWREVTTLRSGLARTAHPITDIRAYGPPANEPSAHERLRS